MEVTDFFGLNSQRRLDQLGWTHQELADRLGIARPMVTRYLQGKTVPGIDLAMKWAKALEIPISALLGPTQASLEERRLTALTAVLRLDASDLDLCLEFLKPFIERSAKKNQRGTANS